MSGQGSSGGSGGGSYNKVGALLIGALGLTGLIIFLGGGGGGDDPAPRIEEVATSVPVPAGTSSAAIVPTAVPVQGNLQPANFDKATLKRDPDSALLTITAYGMPARVNAEAQNASESLSRGAFDPARGTDMACLPDTQYPNPCVTYVLVRKGETVTVTAGNALAGFWPVLDYLSGGGCDLKGGPRDVSCNLTLFNDVDMVAVYYGEDTPNGRYVLPQCPRGEGLTRAQQTSEWAKRCQ